MRVEGFEASQHLRGTVRQTPNVGYAVGARKIKALFADRLAGMLQEEFSIAPKQFSNLINSAG
jgi:hypothetical protein